MTLYKFFIVHVYKENVSHYVSGIIVFYLQNKQVAGSLFEFSRPIIFARAEGLLLCALFLAIQLYIDVGTSVCTRLAGCVDFYLIRNAWKYAQFI